MPVTRNEVVMLLSCCCCYSGLRQCLAHFVSEVSKSCPADQHGTSGELAYAVTIGTINKLKELANNGNIEKYSYQKTSNTFPLSITRVLFSSSFKISSVTL